MEILAQETVSRNVSRRNFTMNIRTQNISQTFDDSSPGLLVEALDVPLLTDLNRGSHVNLNKLQTCVLVEFSGELSLLRSE